MHSETIHGVIGILLAGGKSSRMGTDKGMLELHGKNFASHIFDALSSVFVNVWVIASDPRYKEQFPTVIEDEVPDLGPAGGILTALHQANSPYFIAGCDMPLLNGAAIRYLMKKSVPDHDAGVYTFGGQVYPLPGFYSPRCLNVFEEEVRSGNLKMQSILKKLNTAYVEFPMFEFSAKGKELYNVNDPDDYEYLRKFTS